MNIATAAVLGFVIASQGWTLVAQAQQNDRHVRFGAWLPGNVIESHGDWGVRCEGGDPDSEQGQCEMIQNVSPIGSSAVLLHAAVGWPRESSGESPDPLAVLVVPLGVHLPSGLHIASLNGDAWTEEYQICTEQGCQVELEIDDRFLSIVAEYEELRVVVRGADLAEVGIPLSLDGFEAALDLLQP